MHTYANDLRRRVESGAITVIDSFDGEFIWLSNFYYHDEGVTVEHLFQASKPHKNAMYTGGEYDEDSISWQELILRAETPGKAKGLGRKAPLRKEWGKEREDVMRNALVDKFNVPMLREWLLATGDVPLIEGNTWHDNFWGDCRCNREACIPLGLNHLGLLLMRRRDRLRADPDELVFTPGGDVLMKELFGEDPSDDDSVLGEPDPFRKGE